MKYSCDVQKLKIDDLKGIDGYLERKDKKEHHIKNEKEWFDKVNHVTFYKNEEVLETAKNLAKRKDATLGFKHTFQVGNQFDWREEPSEDFPSGKPKPIDREQFKAMGGAILDVAVKIYGKENIARLELHLDESSPHFHLVGTCVKDGKLNQKEFLKTPLDLTRMRKQFYTEISKIMKCEYEEGNTKETNLEVGKPHDQNLSSKAKGELLKLIGKDPKDKKINELETQAKLDKNLIRNLSLRVRELEKSKVKRQIIKKLEKENADLEENLKMERTARIGLQKTEILYYELMGNVKSKINEEVEKAVKIEKDNIKKQQDEFKKREEQQKAEETAFKAKEQAFDRRATDDPLKLENRALKGRIEIVTRERDDARESAQVWKAEAEATRPERRL